PAGSRVESAASAHHEGTRPFTALQSYKPRRNDREDKQNSTGARSCPRPSDAAGDGGGSGQLQPGHRPTARQAGTRELVADPRQLSGVGLQSPWADHPWEREEVDSRLGVLHGGGLGP